ncbi:hypothetical protein B0H12DRAFT_93405 [Mycena haematopus]|nr:hypothetical protein B0H12DRAFT_93405 [Mycena haematopus]
MTHRFCRPLRVCGAYINPDEAAMSDTAIFRSRHVQLAVFQFFCLRHRVFCFERDDELEREQHPQLACARSVPRRPGYPCPRAHAAHRYQARQACHRLPRRRSRRNRRLRPRPHPHQPHPHRHPQHPRPPHPLPYLAKFTSFATTVLARAEVTPPTVLVSLVYIARARPHLSIALEEWALERVFLGALIVAAKYTNDSTLKNVHWALCTGVFGKRDVGRIEREFLDVLDWELGVGEADLLAHHEGLIAASERSSALASRLTKKAAYLAPPAPARAHTHTRKHSAGAVVPELEPSSPASSLASMSPRTPFSHHATSPAHPHPSHLDPHAHHRAKPVDVPMDVDSTPFSPAPPAQKDTKSGKFHDFLRVFPRSSHHGHRGFPIHVNA